MLSARLDVARVAPSESVRLIAELPFRAIGTTNDDHLLEKVYGDALSVATQQDAPALPRMLPEDAPFLLKAHGTLGRAETIVLAERRRIARAAQPPGLAASACGGTAQSGDPTKQEPAEATRARCAV